MIRDKILITGCHGQLGQDLKALLSDNFTIKGIDIDTVDISDFIATSQIIEKFNPDIVIHAAAYTDVDGCESNREVAMRINGDAAGNIAKVCNRINAKLVYYSTDYVFDGSKKTAYVENDEPNPQTVYGQSKLLGEKLIGEACKNHLILRISWLYGRHGNNFVKTMLKLAQSQINKLNEGKKISPLKVVTDQSGNPTWTADVARQTERLLQSDYQGIFHSSSENICTRYEFAKLIFDKMNLDVHLEPCSTREFPHPAKRPVNSALENQHLKNIQQNIMPDYKYSIERFLELYGKEIINEM